VKSKVRARNVFLILFALAVLGVPIAATQALEPVRIAAVFAMTGLAAETNLPSVQGVRDGIADINRRGGLLGRPVEFLVLDNRSTPVGSKIAAECAVEAEAAVIIGSQWSTHSLAVAQVAQKARIPMVSNASTSARLTQVGPYIFRVCYKDPFQAEVMAAFASKDLKARTAAVAVDLTSDYAMDLSREFGVFFERGGGQVVRVIHYKRGQERYDEVVRAARQADPDVLFIPGYDESAAIILEAAEAGLEAVPLGGDGWSSPSFLRRGKGRLIESFFCTHWAEGVATAVSKDFVKRHGGNVPIPPSRALAYDAVMLAADAVERAGVLDSRRIRDALASTTRFQGVTGTISFNAFGDPVKNAVIMRVQGDRVTYQKTIDPGSSDLGP